MANPGNSQDAFGIGNLISQFKERARDVVRQANAGLEPVREPLRALQEQSQKVTEAAAGQVRQAQQFVRQKQEEARQFARQGLRQLDRGLEPLHLQQADRYIQEKQDKVHQNQRELGGRLQKSWQEMQAQFTRKDAGQAFVQSDGTNVFKPVFDAARATYEATPLHEVQQMVEDGKAAAGKKAGEAIGEGLKQANANFRQGLRQAAPTLQAIDRGIGAFDQNVHQSLPGAPRLVDVSNSINRQRQRNKQAVHEFLMRNDLPDSASQGLQATSKFMQEKGDHAKYYAEASGMAATAGYVQDLDLLHSVGKSGFKVAQVLQKPESRAAFRQLLTRPPDHWETAKKMMADFRESRAARAAQPAAEGAPRAIDHTPIPKDRALWEARKQQELEDIQRMQPQPARSAPLTPEEVAARTHETERRMAGQTREKGLFDPLALESQREVEVSRTAYKSVTGVNPEGGRKNCMSCVMATYNRHHGIPSVALRHPNVERLGFLQTRLDVIKQDYHLDFRKVGGPKDILRQMPDSDTGLLWCRDPNGGERLIQVIKEDGQLAFRDQAGRPVTGREIQGLSDHKFMPSPIEEYGAKDIDLVNLKNYFQSDWQPVHGLDDIAAPLSQEGSSGVLWYAHKDGTAHVVNVANVDGHIVLMDGQKERLLSARELPDMRVMADGTTNYKFMPTPPPHGYEGIAPYGHMPKENRIIGADGTTRLASDAQLQRTLREAGEPPRNIVKGPDGIERPATMEEARRAIDEANAEQRYKIFDADGKARLATEEEARRAIRQAAEQPAPRQGAPASHGEGAVTGGKGHGPAGPGGGEHPPTPPQPPREFGMRPQDQEVFADAARREKRWIIVRETNPEALKYIGDPRCTPKPFEIKAKSANVEGHKYAGLVINPRRHPEAFREPEAAVKEWDKMVAQTKGDQRFTVDRSGRLRMDGKFVHSDYDVYDVVDPKRPVNLSPVGTQGGQPVFGTRGLPGVKDYVNERIGSPVVQHPAEAQFKGHSDQRLIVFGPDGQRFVTDGKQAIEDVYRQRFPGRQALDQSRPFDPHEVPGGPKGPTGVVAGTEFRPRPEGPETGSTPLQTRGGASWAQPAAPESRPPVTKAPRLSSFETPPAKEAAPAKPAPSLADTEGRRADLRTAGRVAEERPSFHGRPPRSPEEEQRDELRRRDAAGFVARARREAEESQERIQRPRARDQAREDAAQRKWDRDLKEGERIEREKQDPPKPVTDAQSQQQAGQIPPPQASQMHGKPPEADTKAQQQHSPNMTPQTEGKPPQQSVQKPDSEKAQQAEAQPQHRYSPDRAPQTEGKPPQQSEQKPVAAKPPEADAKPQQQHSPNTTPQAEGKPAQESVQKPDSGKPQQAEAQAQQYSPDTTPHAEGKPPRQSGQKPDSEKAQQADVQAQQHLPDRAPQTEGKPPQQSEQKPDTAKPQQADAKAQEQPGQKPRPEETLLVGAKAPTQGQGEQPAGQKPGTEKTQRTEAGQQSEGDRRAARKAGSEPAAPNSDPEKWRTEGNRASGKSGRSRDLGEDPRGRQETPRQQTSPRVDGKEAKTRDLGQDPRHQPDAPRRQAGPRPDGKESKSRDLGEDPRRQQDAARQQTRPRVDGKESKSRDLGEDPGRQEATRPPEQAAEKSAGRPNGPDGRPANGGSAGAGRQQGRPDEPKDQRPEQQRQASNDAARRNTEGLTAEDRRAAADNMKQKSGRGEPQKSEQRGKDQRPSQPPPAKPSPSQRT